MLVCVCVCGEGGGGKVEFLKGRRRANKVNHVTALSILQLKKRQTKNRRQEYKVHSCMSGR